MDSTEMICEFNRRNVRFDSQRFKERWSIIQESSSLIIDKPLKIGDWRYLMNLLAEVDVSRIEHLVLELPYQNHPPERDERIERYPRMRDERIGSYYKGQEVPSWFNDMDMVSTTQVELELGSVLRTGRFSALKMLRILSSESGQGKSGQISCLEWGQSLSLAAAFKKGKFTNLLTLSLPPCDPLPILEALTEGGISKLTSFSIIGKRVYSRNSKPLFEALDAIFKSGSLKNLRTLGLFYGVFEDSSCWKVFTRAMGSGLLPNIRALSLSESPLHGFDLADLFRGPRNPFRSLENLSLHSCQISSQQLCAMVDAIMLVSKKTRLALNNLDLHNNPLEKDAIHAIKKLADSGCLQQLQKLDLNSISAKDPRDVLRLLGTFENGSLPNFQSLNWNTKLDDEVAEVIMQTYFQNKAMTVELDVDWNDVTDRSLRIKVKEYRERNVRIAALKGKLGTTNEKITTLSRAKVFICGYPEVGKTKLRKSLVRDRGLLTKLKWETRPNLFKEPRTRGIELSHIVQKNIDGPQTELVLWDLAGQEEYLVLHGTFLADLGFEGGKATTFLLVFRAPFRSEVEGELLFWFRFVASSSLVKRRVVIVLNCFDGKQSTENDQLKWVALIRSSATLFGDLLDICLDPFIMDVRVAAHTKPLKDYLFDHARTLLRDVEVPRVCFELLEELKGWSASRKSKHIPIFTWEAFEKTWKLKHKESHSTEKDLKSAASYLHEIGEIIYFKEKDLTEQGSGNRSIVIPDPQWFCKEVVGQLLLREEMLEGKSSLEVHADGSLSIGVFQKFFEHSLAEGTRSEDVISMLERLGLCFRKGEDEIIVPALIRKDNYNSIDWEGHGFHAVMGRCFAAADTERMAIPVTLFRRLQVELAQDANFGGCSDSEYRAGKSFSNFKVGELLVLIQFDVDHSDPIDDRIDILVKSGIQGDLREVRLAQIKCICEIMQKLEDLRNSCCPGMECDTKIIKPWRASERTPKMIERRLMSLKEMGDLFIKGRKYLSWLLNGNPVELHSFFSVSEMDDFRKKQTTVSEATTSANSRSGVAPEVDEVTEIANISLEIIEESEEPDEIIKEKEGLDASVKVATEREFKIVLSDRKLKALQDKIVASKEIAESEYGELMRFVRSAGLLREDSLQSRKESAEENIYKVLPLTQDSGAVEKQTSDHQGSDEVAISAIEKQGNLHSVDGVTEDPNVKSETGETSERLDVSLETTSEQGLAKRIQECGFDEVVISATEKQGGVLRVDGFTEDSNVKLKTGEPSDRPVDSLDSTSEQRLSQMIQEYSQWVINAVSREALLTRQTVRQDGHRTRQLVDKVTKQVLEVQAQQAFSIKERESSVPRYMFLTRKKGNSSVWISLKGAFRSSFQLHLLCEAHFDDGFLHEVEEQEGIELRRLKKWLVKVSPWLRRSLQVAIMVGKTVGNIYVPGVFNIIPDVNYLESDVEELARAVDRAATMLEDEDEEPIQVQDDHQENGTATRPHIDLKERMIAEQVVEELRVELGRDVFAKKIGLKRVLLITTAQPDEGSSKQAEPSVLWICRECYKKYRASPEGYKILQHVHT